MTKIDVDDQVYDTLKKMAEPFVDSPNTVLRRILNLDKITSEMPIKLRRARPTLRIQMEDTEVRSKQFVEKVLAKEFGRNFNRRGRFVYLLESKSHLVYFQNFNAAYENAWYRIGATARRELKESRKKTFICLTVPAEGEYYLIPYEDIEAQIEHCNWSRPDLEVNIDRLRSHWRELKWDISSYRRSLNSVNGDVVLELEDKK
jgi:hypothetical protein